MPFTKTLQQLVEETLIQLERETGMSNITRESVIGKIIERSLTEVAIIDSDLSSALDNYNLSTADDSGLTELGELFGVPRKSARIAISSSAALRFSIQSPRQTDVVIPAGTQVWSQNSQNRYFITIDTATIPAGETVTFVGIRAPSEGAFYSAAKNTLTLHGFSDKTVSCTNIAAVSGNDFEPTDNYRYRLSYARFSKNTNKRDAIKQKILSIPGVLDARVFPWKRGSGTIDVIVYTDEPTPDPVFIAEVQDYIETELAAEGISVYVSGPDTVEVGLVVAIGFLSTTTPTERTTLRSVVEQSVRYHLNTLDFGQSFIPGVLETDIRNISPNIIGVDFTKTTIDGTERSVNVVNVTELQRIIAGTIMVI